HVLTAANDHVLRAIRDVEIAVFVEVTDVARVEPAVDHGLLRVFRAAPITWRHRRTADEDQARTARLHVVAVVVDDSNLDDPPRATDRGLALDVLVAADARRHAVRLGPTV